MKNPREFFHQSKLQQTSIRTRLLYSFLLIASLPALTISITSVVLGYIEGQRNTLNQLSSISDLKELEITTWINDVRNELNNAINEEYALDRARVVLQLVQDEFEYQIYRDAARYRFNKFTADSLNLTQISLVDLHGNVVLSTNTDYEGQNLSNFDFFDEEMTGFHVEMLPGETFLSTNTAIASIPILSSTNELLGYLLGYINAQQIQTSLVSIPSRVENSLGYVIDENNQFVGGINPTGDVEILESVPANEALKTHENISGIYRNANGLLVFGVYKWLPDIDQLLIIEQDLIFAFRAIMTNLLINIGISVFMTVFAVAASIFVTRSISTPVGELVETANEITNGNLEKSVEIKSKDEFGTLANAFNLMTSRLRNSINTLEENVEERTHALQHRARQLEIISTISQEITSILNINTLLNRIVELIQASFHYTYVSIYLLDEENNNLVLHAYSGKNKPGFLTFPMNKKSLNVLCAQSRKPINVQNTDENPNFLYDPAIPDTKSELVIPLSMGEKIIGTLDVHNNQTNAFSDEEILVIQSLGDQIAIAIENARRYDSSARLAVLEERERLSRDLHDSVIQSLYSTQLLTGSWRPALNKQPDEIEDYFDNINQTLQKALKEMRLLIYELKPAVLQEEGLMGALHARLDAVEKRAGIDTKLDADEFLELPQEIEKELFWIANEALNNILKYAHARHVTIHFYEQNYSLIMDIQDDGYGFDLTTKTGGMGLKNMQDRANRIRANLVLESEPGEGTLIRVIVDKDWISDGSN